MITMSIGNVTDTDTENGTAKENVSDGTYRGSIFKRGKRYLG